MNLEHSKYIYQIIKRYGILSNEPRKPLSEHEIIDINDTKNKLLLHN